MRSFLLLLVLAPLVQAPALAQQEPNQDQKDFISSMILVGRIQAACTLHSNGVLAPIIAKQFIELNLKSMPNGGGPALLNEIKEKDSTCYSLFQ